MTLQPQGDANNPGLWVNPNWQEGTAGTFALIVGVSRYKHLNGGDEPTEDHGARWIVETRRLGQLGVSALTAFELFRWIRDGYRIDGVPVAKCWLLLSPTAAEINHRADIGANPAVPTFDACKRAIGSWYGSMARLARPAAERSRLFFFFSGHGLQVHHDEQILLPADYLAPPLMSLNDALSTQNLLHGLAPLPVGRQFFFVDACRNDHQELRNKRITGAPILNVDVAAVTNPNRVAPLLYATAAGQRAWGHPNPDKGLSLFGRALLDGLLGTPNMELACTNGTCAVNVYPLQRYLQQRVVELLKAEGAEVIQPVKLSGEPADETITFVDRAALPPGLARPPEPPPTAAPGPGGVPMGGAIARRVERMLDESFTESLSVSAGPWTQQGHELFGSEHVTAVWTGRARLYALGTRRWLDAGALAVHRVDHDQATRHYRVELEVADPDPLGHWVQLVDTAGVAHGCVLARDHAGPPRYVVEFDVAYSDDGGREFTRLEAYLSPLSPGPLGAAGALWQRYRTADVGEAVSAFELSELEQMVRGKLDSPLAATVAALVLLRANRLDKLHDWLRNLAHWFGDRADGPVLWAEQALRQEADRRRAIGLAAEYLGLLLERGLPHTSEGLGYAASLADRLLGGADHLPGGARDRLETVRRHIQNALTFFRPGGLFAAYSHFDPETDRPPVPTGTPTAMPERTPPQPEQVAPIPALEGTSAAAVSIEDDRVIIGGVVLRRERSRDD